MIDSSVANTLKNIFSEKRMGVSKNYFEVLETFERNTLLFSGPALFGANAILLSNPDAMFKKFKEHAFTESHGGRLIKKIANKLGGKHRLIMLKHAEDEMRHGLMFLSLLRSLGEEIEDNVLGDEDYIEDYYLDIEEEFGGSLFEFMAFTHAAEVKTFYNIQQIIVISKIFNSNKMKKIRKMFLSILKDEIFHIRYTANILDKYLSYKENQKILLNVFDLAEKQALNTINNIIKDALP